MNEILIATTNPGKLKEIAGILTGVPIKLLTLNDLEPIARLPVSSLICQLASSIVPPKSLRLSCVKRSKRTFWMMIDRLMVTSSGGRSSPSVKFNRPRWSA